jgi:ABC-2 type transport system ATP-binding protein
MSAGCVRINGAELPYELEEIRRYIGYMPDYCGAYPDLLVADFLELFARVHGLYGSTRGRRIASLVEMLHLGDLLPQPVEVLSKGQKQRLSLARALVGEPRVLILDEPAAGLDPRARSDLFATLRGLVHDGLTLFISSHILGELADLAGWVVAIDAGRVMYAGNVGALARMGPGGSGWRIDLAADAPQAARWLAAQPAVLQVTVEGESTLCLRLDEHRGAVDGVVALLVEHGARVRGVRRIQRGLEQLFVEACEPS